MDWAEDSSEEGSRDTYWTFGSRETGQISTVRTPTDDGHVTIVYWPGSLDLMAATTWIHNIFSLGAAAVVIDWWPGSPDEASVFGRHQDWHDALASKFAEISSGQVTITVTASSRYWNGDLYLWADCLGKDNVIVGEPEVGVRVLTNLLGSQPTTEKLPTRVMVADLLRNSTTSGIIRQKAEEYLDRILSAPFGNEKVQQVRNYGVAV